MPDVSTHEPTTDAISSQSLSIISVATAIEVKDRISYAVASTALSDGKEILKQIDDYFDPQIKRWHDGHKAELAKKKEFAGPIEVALRGVKLQMTQYEMKLEQVRRAEEVRLATEARQAEEARAIAEAALLERQGKQDEANAVLDEAIAAPAPVVVLEKFQPSEFGRSSRTIWRWEITDVSKIPVAYLTVVKNQGTGLLQDINTTGIGAIVRSMKGNAAKQIPGIRVWEDRVVV